MMKRAFIITVLSIVARVAATSNLAAQTNDADTTSVSDEYDLVDSIIFVPSQAMDSTLCCRNIFRILSDKQAGSCCQPVLLV